MDGEWEGDRDGGERLAEVFERGQRGWRRDERKRQRRDATHSRADTDALRPKTERVTLSADTVGLARSRHDQLRECPLTEVRRSQWSDVRRARRIHTEAHTHHSQQAP